MKISREIFRIQKPMWFKIECVLTKIYKNKLFESI